MSDETYIDPDSETPVNPYSLLEAVNRSSDTAHTAWLIFLGVMAYLMIAVAGVTHKQLLLQTDVQLPILNVNIPQVQFFQFAPVFLLLFHFGLISQLALLARKTLEFDSAVRHLEPTRRRTHPLRLELHNFFFVQGVAGPHRSAIMSLFLHSMSWLTLVILPVVLLLFIQLSFLPYHDSVITWSHRIVLVLDIIVLILIGVFLTRADTSFFKAFWRTSIAHPISFLVTTVILAAVAFFSFAIATIPDKALDRAVKKYVVPLIAAGRDSPESPYLSGFVIPYMWGAADGSLFGLFHRNLIVRDLDLVVDRDVSKGEPSLSLRGRDLRYAQLDRSDLHQADLTGANLDGASLIGTKLGNIRLGCADENELLFGLGRQKAGCGSARKANFYGADLGGANLTGIDLSGAKLERANLEHAILRLSILEGSNFSNANLRKADLTAGVLAQGAEFLVAKLEGADLNGAQLQYADFSNAQLQSASLAHAHLQGAILRGAMLNAADLYKARLQGADMAGADLTAADLREAFIWMTAPPGNDKAKHANFRDVTLQPLTAIDTEMLGSTLEAMRSSELQTLARESVAPIMKPDAAAWADTQAHSSWQTLIQEAPLNGDADYRHALTLTLESLICKARWAGGSVAQGIARRARSQRFAGDLAAIVMRLKNGNEQCLGAQKVDTALMRDLAALLEDRVGQ